MLKGIVFYISSALIILFSFLMLKFRNIFYSLLSAMMVFFMVAVLFFILGSEYNAIIQFAIYGFAIPIILGLGIMFTNFNKQNQNKKSSNSKYLIFLFGGIFILALIYLIKISLTIVPDEFNIINQSEMNSLENISLISKGIFIKYVWAFEIFSLILTIIVAGLTVFKTKKGDL